MRTSSTADVGREDDSEIPRAGAGMKGSSGRGWMLRSWAQKPLTHGDALHQPVDATADKESLPAGEKEFFKGGWWLVHQLKLHCSACDQFLQRIGATQSSSVMAKSPNMIAP